MNWLDIVIIIVIAGSTFAGLKNGIIKSVLSLLGIIVGVVLAGRYYTAFSAKFTFIPHEGAAKIVAFAIILIAVIIVAILIAKLLKWAVSVVMLGWVDYLGGAVFGLVIGGIFCGAFLAIWVNFLGAGGVIHESLLAAVLLDTFPLVLALLPGEFDAVRSFFQ